MVVLTNAIRCTYGANERPETRSGGQWGSCDGAQGALERSFGGHHLHQYQSGGAVSSPVLPLAVSMRPLITLEGDYGTHGCIHGSRWWPLWHAHVTGAFTRASQILMSPPMPPGRAPGVFGRLSAASLENGQGGYCWGLLEFLGSSSSWS